MRKVPARWIGQLGLAIALTWFLWQRVADDWQQFNIADIAVQLEPLWLLAAAAIVAGTYGLLILTWRTVLRGWHQQLALGAATRIWLVSNLGRYLPGKLWSVAGLAVMAQRAGVSGWAATGAAVIMQALALGTAAVVVAAVLPGAATPLSLIVSALAAILVILLLRSRAVLAMAGRVGGAGGGVTPLPLPHLVAGAVATLTAWIAYGVAFWMTAQGLTVAPELSVPTAVGTFAAAYVVGLLALFAPGGMGVREAFMVGLLADSVGGEAAIVLAVGSRLLMTGTEIISALGALVISRGISDEVA